MYRGSPEGSVLRVKEDQVVVENHRERALGELYRVFANNYGTGGSTKNRAPSGIDGTSGSREKLRVSTDAEGLRGQVTNGEHKPR